jgi:O-antigen ligase
MRANSLGWIVLSATLGAAVALSDGVRWKLLIAAGCVGATVLVIVTTRPEIPDARVGSIWGPRVAILSLLTSTLVWRVRDAQALASTPFDPAVLIRGGWEMLALGVATLTYLQSRRAGGVPLGWPMRLMIAYCLAAVPGIVLSAAPLLTFLRVVEISVFVAVPVLLWEARGRRAAVAMRDSVVMWLWILAIAAWVNGFIVTGALLQADSPIPWQLSSVWPVIAANSVGTIGAALGAISFARLLSHPTRKARRLALLGLAFGVVTLVAAQYRTGYVALTAAVLVSLLVSRGRTRWALLALAIAAVFALTSRELVGQFGVAVLRGESWQEASDLSGRFVFWSAGLPVWQESPLFGQGLLTATRFEVLENLGQDLTSTIHGTWIEALVGTGLVGAGLLFAAFVAALKSAWLVALRGFVEPLALMVTLGVRSLTGSTIEIAGFGVVGFAAFVLISRVALSPVTISSKAAYTDRQASPSSPAMVRGGSPW